MPSAYATIAQWLRRLCRTRLVLASLVVAVALLFVVNPEIRLLLLWLDFIGFDLVLLILAFELRHFFGAVRPLFVAVRPFWILSLIFPKISPSLTLVETGPRVALCALLLPLAASAGLVWNVMKAVAGRGGGL